MSYSVVDPVLSLFLCYFPCRLNSFSLCPFRMVIGLDFSTAIHIFAEWEKNAHTQMPNQYEIKRSQYANRKKVAKNHGKHREKMWWERRKKTIRSGCSMATFFFDRKWPVITDLCQSRAGKMFMTLIVYVCGDGMWRRSISFHFVRVDLNAWMLSVVVTGHTYVFGIDDTINRETTTCARVCVNIDQRSLACFLQAPIHHGKTTRILYSTTDLHTDRFDSNSFPILRKKIKIR